MNEEYSGKVSKDCLNAHQCRITAEFSSDHEENSLIHISFTSRDGGQYRYVGIERMVDFVCPDEYCEPDNELVEFVNWMRDKEYPECITSAYVDWSLAPQTRVVIKEAIAERANTIEQPLVIPFIDVIPLDEGATYRPLGEGEGGNCIAHPVDSNFCSEPVPADYLFLQEQFRKTFGMNVVFEYVRMEIDYSETFGQPTLVNDSFYRFGRRYAFLTAFEHNAIIHYALQTWNGKRVGNMTGASHVAEVSYEPFDTFGVTVFTHEWGHTLGLPHSFVTVDGRRQFMGFDGIMNNTYGGDNDSLLDPLSPMERYALEPVDGYRDEAYYANDYSEAHIGSGLLPQCQEADPAIVNAELVGETEETFTYLLEITNHGDITSGYVDLAVYNGGFSSGLIEQRTLWKIVAGETMFHKFTVDKPDVLSHTLVFVLDREDKISENDENNFFTAQTPLRVIEIGEAHGAYVVDNVEVTGALPGKYRFLANGPTNGWVSLMQDDIVLSRIWYDWLSKVSATDPSRFYTFDFPGFFKITVRKNGTGTMNLYSINHSVFDGSRILAVY